ncbi:MAG: DUF1566 domain-containing protein, partial [Theionarchaea archaeon]|nr:DUF1566 domain-containing protein [Theionarchaea archaeon]
MNKVILALLLVFLCCASLAQQHNDGKYTLVGTGQSICYDHTGEIPCPQYGESFFGQDAHHKGRSPSYVDNGDG